MTATGDSIVRAGFENRLRYRERACVLGAIAAASLHLAFMLAPVTAVAEGAVAALLAAAVTRFGVGMREEAERSAGRVARRVLVVVLASLVVAPVWVAMLDPTRGIAAAPWRSILLAAGVCGGIAALIAGQWTRLELDPAARGLHGLLLATAWGPLLLLADGLARAHEQHWSAGRSGLAAFALVGAAGLLAGSLARRLSGVVESSRPRSGVESAVAEADRVAREKDRLAALEAELERARELAQVLGLERDRQVVEQAQASELVGGAGPVLQAGRVAQLELFARLAAARSAVTRLRGARDAIEGRADAVSLQLESTAQQLALAERTNRRRTVAATNLLLASRETATGLTDLGRHIETLEPSTASLTELSLDVVARVELGRARLAETVAGMEAIRAATHTAETVIRGLAQRTREIGGILDVIDDVGDQTSLLALNAAIIAAQAGEHGRAFSVVAEEIRDLADRVLVGTKEVGGLIRAVQAESEQAIEAIEAGSAAVLQGVERSVDTGRAFDEITRVARDSGERIADVVETVRTQTQALGRVESVAARIEAAARELAELHGARKVDELDLERSALEGRAAVEELRAAVRDQTGELVRIEGELRLVDERGRDADRALESGIASADAIGRVIAGGSERVQGLESAIERLAGHRRELIRRVEALRGVGSSPDPASQRTEPVLRATGDLS